MRVFVAVHETRSLTLAAARLFVTQPAISQALGRLRRELDDPLFERDGRVMRPTALAETVYPGFRAALSSVDRALEGVRGFDPADSRRRFRIALSELGEIGWLPAILREVRAAAPLASVEVVGLEPQALPEWLARGTVDLAITPDVSGVGSPGVALKSERYVAVMSTRHALAHRALDLADYAAAAHVAVASDSGGPVLAAARARAGVAVEPRVEIRHIATLPALLTARDDLLATIPATIADGWRSTWPLVARDLPFDMPPVELRLHRRATSQQLGALEWFHDLVVRAVRASAASFAVFSGEAAAG